MELSGYSLIMKNKFMLIVALLMCIVGSISCSKAGYVDGDISPKSYYATNGGGNFYVDITASEDGHWRLYTEGDWIRLGQSNGSGNAHVNVYVDPNNESYTRKGYIVLDYTNEYGGGTYGLRCEITQPPMPGSGGNNNNNNGGSTGGNNNTGGSGSDSNTGGNSGGNTGGTSVSVPSAPTYVYVENYGNSYYPEVRISWNESVGATSYTVYRSTSANGSYSLIKTTSYTYASDTNVTLGNKYYYKVKASNSAGSSGYSNYAVFEYKDTRKPGPVTYGNCSVSGTQMTLRWSLPSTYDYGKPTKAILRIKNPDNDNWVDLQELSGTATSVTFTYTPWICTEQYTKGYVYVGILLKNDYGTGGGSAKIYDTSSGRWMN